MITVAEPSGFNGCIQNHNKIPKIEGRNFVSIHVQKKCKKCIMSFILLNMNSFKHGNGLPGGSYVRN
jgi:hypothetical protein